MILSNLPIFALVIDGVPVGVRISTPKEDYDISMNEFTEFHVAGLREIPVQDVDGTLYAEKEMVTGVKVREISNNIKVVEKALTWLNKRIKQLQVSTVRSKKKSLSRGSLCLRSGTIIVFVSKWD